MLIQENQKNFSFPANFDWKLKKIARSFKQIEGILNGFEGLWQGKEEKKRTAKKCLKRMKLKIVYTKNRGKT